MSDSQRIAASLFAVVAAGILLSAILVTLAIAGGAPDALRLPFRLICHGISDRCLHLAGEAMPICLRCSAIYVGMLIGIVSSVPWTRFELRRFPGWAALVLGLPMIFDGVTQLFGLRDGSNGLRVVTGLVAGYGFLLWALTNIGPGRALGDSRERMRVEGKESLGD